MRGLAQQPKFSSRLLSRWARQRQTPVPFLHNLDTRAVVGPFCRLGCVKNACDFSRESLLTKPSLVLRCLGFKTSTRNCVIVTGRPVPGLQMKRTVCCVGREFPLLCPKEAEHSKIGQICFCQCLVEDCVLVLQGPPLKTNISTAPKLRCLKPGREGNT